MITSHSLVVWSSLLVAAHSQAADSVTVHTVSGRQFQGQVDPRTDETALWLRTGKSQAFVRRPIVWERVVAVQLGEKKYSAAEFLRLIGSPDWQWAVNPFEDEPVANSSDVKNLPASEDASPNHQVAHWEPGTAAQNSESRVAAIHIDAEIANWDSDVEVDGLLVHIFPLDANGETIAALGTLEVNLIGEGPTNLVRGNPFPALGRWSQIIRPENVGAGGAVVRLPFQGVSPDFRGKWHLGSFGMVHARLSVAGQGIFEDTAAFTRLRPYSPVRDRMQQLRGQRFHPWELTSQ